MKSKINLLFSGFISGDRFEYDESGDEDEDLRGETFLGFGLDLTVSLCFSTCGGGGCETCGGG